MNDDAKRPPKSREAKEAKWASLVSGLCIGTGMSMSKSTSATHFTVATYLICIASVLAGFSVYRSVSLWKKKELSLAHLLAHVLLLGITTSYTIHVLFLPSR